MKKKNIITLLLLLLTIGASAQVKFSTGTLDEAKKQAKAENKYLFVDFYTDWCNPCKMMDRDVFSRTDVGDFLNDNMICLKVNAELPENVEIAKKNKITAYPMMILFDTKGKEVKRFTGFQQAEMLLKDLRVISGADLSYEDLYAKYQKNKKDLDIQQQLLIEAPYFIQSTKGYEHDKWSVRIETLFSDYVKKKGLKNMVNAPDFAIIMTFHTEMEKEDPIFENVVKNYDGYIKEVSPEDISGYIISMYNSHIIQMCKDGDQNYKKLLERINDDLKVPYSGTTFGSLSVYEAVSLLADGTYYLYKKKDFPRYFETMDKYLNGLGEDATVNDYTQVLEDMHVAGQGQLSPEAYAKCIQWIGIALEKPMNESVRVKLLIILSDSYVGVESREKAKQSLNQAFIVSSRVANPDEMKFLQETIKAKLQQL